MKEEILTNQEKEIINIMIDLYDKYDKLEVQHHDDKEEFINALHIMQHLIMIRAVRRYYPDLFPSNVNNENFLIDKSGLGALGDLIQANIKINGENI